MAESWQTWFAALLCLAAAAYIARRAWLAFAGQKSGCGTGCTSCAHETKEPDRKVLLAIQPESDRRV